MCCMSTCAHVAIFPVVCCIPNAHSHAHYRHKRTPTVWWDDRAAQWGVYPWEVISLSLSFLPICYLSFQARRSLKFSGAFFKKGYYWLPLILYHAAHRPAIPPFYVPLPVIIFWRQETRRQGFRKACHQCLETLSSLRLWLCARHSYHITKRPYCFWYLIALLFCLSLSESLSCSLNVCHSFSMLTRNHKTISGYKRHRLLLKGLLEVDPDV